MRAGARRLWIPFALYRCPRRTDCRNEYHRKSSPGTADTPDRSDFRIRRRILNQAGFRDCNPNIARDLSPNPARRQSNLRPRQIPDASKAAGRRQPRLADLADILQCDFAVRGHRAWIVTITRVWFHGRSNSLFRTHEGLFTRRQSFAVTELSFHSARWSAEI